MNTIIQTTEILKADSKGRLRLSAQRREGILDEFEKSGLSARSFVKMIGVNYQTFMSWLQKRRKGRDISPLMTQPPRAAPMRFAEALIVGESAEKAVLTIELPGGSRLKIYDAQQLELACQLLATLAKKESMLC